MATDTPYGYERSGGAFTQNMRVAYFHDECASSLFSVALKRRLYFPRNAGPRAGTIILRALETSVSALDDARRERERRKKKKREKTAPLAARTEIERCTRVHRNFKQTPVCVSHV